MHGVFRCVVSCILFRNEVQKGIKRGLGHIEHQTLGVFFSYEDLPAFLHDDSRALQEKINQRHQSSDNYIMIACSPFDFSRMVLGKT